MSQIKMINEIPESQKTQEIQGGGRKHVWEAEQSSALIGI